MCVEHRVVTHGVCWNKSKVIRGLERLLCFLEQNLL